MTTKVAGYHLSPTIASLDMFVPSMLWGTVTGSIDDLRIPLDPGPIPQIDVDLGLIEKYNAENERRQNSPLRGAPIEKSS
jgi:hypothetical protein